MRLEIDEFTFCGESISTRATTIAVPQLGVCFDLGWAPRESVRCATVLLSHGHIDHAGGVYDHVAKRRSIHVPEATYYAPAEIVPYVREFIAAGKRLNAFNAQVYNMPEILVASSEEYAPIGRELYVKSFRAQHSVPSVGYCIYRRSQKLLEKYSAFDGKLLAQMRKQGEEITRTSYAPIVAFSGDTRIEAVLQCPDALAARILILECTFLDSGRAEERPVEAWRRGHTHELDICEHAHAFTCKHLVLAHFSRRYNEAEIEAARVRISNVVSCQVHAFY